MQSNHSAHPAISLNDVTKKFGDVMAVNGVSFDVAAGEMFAFLGPNGAGKSTTIKMLTALLRPTSGTLTLNGHNVATEPDAARRTFGIVFQDPSVDNELTAYENMELHAALYNVPRNARRSRINELLKLVELDTRSGSFVKTFSGGMIRRLEIARGLLHHPKILFLDEPTIGLDTQTRTLLWNYVRNLSHDSGMTVFFTTHYLEEAEDSADRIAIIDQGRIVAIGSVEQLTSQTNTDSLEEAYLALTGTAIREESADARQNLRRVANARGRQR